MSESEEHKRLVRIMLNNLVAREANICLYVDLPDYSSNLMPPECQFRPDIYGRNFFTGNEYICEAKTLHDLKTERSYSQLSAFVDYINRQSSGSFVLGGYGSTARRGKTLLRFVVQDIGCLNCSIQVFDGLDYWELDKLNGEIWHLR